MKRAVKFTLVEVLLVIAVFVLMMGMLLEFLTGTQRIWGGVRGKGDTFVESKSGMDFAVSLLKNVVVNTDYKGENSSYRSSYFVITDDDPGDSSDYADMVRFFTRSTILGSRKVYWVELCRNEASDELQFKFRDAEDDLPSSEVDAYLNIDTFWQNMLDAENASGQFTGNDYGTDTEVLLERVTSFFVLTGNKDGDSVKWERQNTSRFPSVLMLNIGMMTAEDYAIYLELEDSGKDDFRKQKEMTFSRMIYFDQAEARGRGQE